MKNSTKSLTAIILAGGLLGIAAPAFAGTSNAWFDVTLANMQQPRHTGNQAKALSNADGHIDVSSVGSTYTVNAKLHRGMTYGTEVKGLSDNTSAWLANNYTAGNDQIQLTLTNNTWTYVTVRTTGYWRSN